MRKGGSAPGRGKKYLLVSAGVVCVGLGVAGVFVPLLPTTPFLLLAGACFLRSSDRLYTWLTTNRLVGSYVRNYMELRATTLTTKIASITMLWVFLALAALFFTESWLIRSLLLVVAVGVTIHLGTLKTIKPSRAGEGMVWDTGGAAPERDARNGRI